MAVSFQSRRSDDTAVGFLADYHEAIACAHNKANRASVAMSRRALQQIALDKAAPPNDRLIAQIDWLADQSLITEQLRKAAHIIRALGNEGAHPNDDNLDNLDRDDAEDALSFLREVVDYVYVLPYRISVQESRIAERRKPTKRA